MDPRHPELALSRIKELIKQYERIESDILHATVSSKLGQLEREGGLVVQEICLVAPRLHEAMMQASRQRRSELTRWESNVTRETVTSPLYNVGDAEVSQAKGEEAKREAPVEIVEPKPRKKKTTKKKKAE